MRPRWRALPRGIIGGLLTLIAITIHIVVDVVRLVA
jgi:hypothetical protein